MSHTSMTVGTAVYSLMAAVGGRVINDDILTIMGVLTGIALIWYHAWAGLKMREETLTKREARQRAREADIERG